MEHIARAAVDAMAYQTRDVLEVMQAEAGLHAADLKVDGGAAANAMLLQFQADQLGVPVRRPVVAETTALGAAYLAGLAVGYWDGLDDVRRNWALDREFSPAMSAEMRERGYRGWKKAVTRARAWATEEADCRCPTAQPAEFLPSTPRTSSGRRPCRAMARCHRL